MRRFLSLFTMLMLCGVLAFAQDRVVSGKVMDKDGNPVPFASVKIKGSRSGISADANGAYTIRVNSNSVLEITGTGFAPTDVSVGNLTVINTVMEKVANELKEVVVTGAFGIKRASRSTASNVQNLTSDQVNTIRQNNINNALAGKVAGAQVRSQSAAKLGEETAVRLRGENGLLAGGGALYVVDGTIMPSANDINPDDIEDYTILQGPSAAALFGPDGANGAIVMNTKKAKRGSKNLGVEINSGIQFDRIYISPNYQNSYAGGGVGDLIQYNYEAGQPEAWMALDGKYYHDYTDDASWGPRMMGQEYIPWYAWYSGHERSFQTAKLTPQPNNVRDFYNTGITKTNNINFSKAGDNYNIRVSYTNLDQKGMVPYEWLKRHTLNLTSSIDLSTRLTLATNINYLAQNRNGENNDAYGSQSAGSFSQWFHRNLDMGIMRELTGLRTPTGILASWNHANPDAYDPAHPETFYRANFWLSYHTYFNQISNLDRRERLFGDVSLTYKINNDLRIKGTYRKNNLTTNTERIYPTILEVSSGQAGFNPFQGNGRAAYGSRFTITDRQNYEGLLIYSKKIRDFAINATGGFDILRVKYREAASNTVDGLNVPNLYSIGNSRSPITNHLRADRRMNHKEQSLRRSLFVRADVGFRNLFFVEGTYRRDYSSTEPQGNFIETKSIGASFIFSDLIKNSVPFISYGKLRASTGQLLNTLGIYQLNATYNLGANQWSGNFVMNEPDRLVDPFLEGAVNSEKEIGLEMRFLRNRFGFNVTYWDRTNKNFPVDVSVPGQTGYTLISKNAGEIAKTGIDVQVFVNPVRATNFDWNITATWGRLLRNEVVSIFPGITRLQLTANAFGATTALAVNEIGQPWGQLFGGGIRRINGKPVINENGLYEREANTKFGSVLPDYTGGVQSTFNIFKNFTLNVNIDYSYGGKFFSLSDFWGTFSGLTARTAVLNDRGNSVRDAVEDGGGVHVIGVDAAGHDVDMYVDAQTYFHQFRNNNIGENSIYDLTFVKMREVSFGYRLPVEKLGIGKYVKNAVFSIVSRNPWLIYAKTKDFDPSEISNLQGEEAQMPGSRSIGVNLRLGF